MRSLKYNIEISGFDVPYSDNINILSAPLTILGKTVSNRISILAPFGCDAKTNGEFSIYSHRRYARFAVEGAGIIFTEPIAISDDFKKSNQLCLNASNLNNFKNEVEFIKNVSIRENGISPVIILRVDLSLDTANMLVDICSLAEKAGFDGICADVCCYTQNSSFDELKSSVGSGFIFTAVLNEYKSTECIYKIKKVFDNLIVVADLKCDSLNLNQLNDNISAISSFQILNPDVTVLTHGYSEFGYEGINLASGMVEKGFCKLVGFSKQAVAYPSFIRDLQGGHLDKSKCCTLCKKCERLQQAGQMSGCVVFDSETYMPQYDKII